ncbi:MAG: sortase domain-bontaining protein [Clostridium sp.]
MKNTKIDYPVMQTKKDSEYYLHRNFEKKSDVNGLPFLDAKCGIDELKGNLMVYGHHMKSGLMFAHLEDFEKADFYKKHKTIEFDTLYEKRQYEVVAVFRSKVYKENEDVFKYYRYVGKLSKKQYETYVKNCKKLSIYKDGATPAYGEQLLTLVTCAYHTENGRFVVVARKKRECMTKEMWQLARMHELKDFGERLSHYENDEMLIDEVDEGFCNMMGYTQSELMIRSCGKVGDLIYPPDYEEIRYQIRKI